MGAGPLEEAGPLKLRAFFGLPVPEAQRDELDRYLAACAATAANLHLTVRFIGGIERSVVDEVADRLAETELRGFDVALGGVGTFKRGRLARVVWLHVDAGLEKARELAALVEEACVGAGLVPETRPFQPHLTLARARSRDGAPLALLPPPPALPPWRAGELILYQSRLGRAGAVYEAVRSLRLS